MTFVRTDFDEGIAIITLGDPATLNAMTPALMGDLARAGMCGP